MAIRLPTPKKKSTTFHVGEPPASARSAFDERVGPYIAINDFLFTRYNIPQPVSKGMKVTAMEDRTDRVLVEFKQGTCLYMESDVFDANFRRA